MQESYPSEMTKVQASMVGKLQREYFTNDVKMRFRREELRAQGQKVEPAVKMTVEQMLARGAVILLALTTEKDFRVRKAFRAELYSLAYALSDA